MELLSIFIFNYIRNTQTSILNCIIRFYIGYNNILLKISPPKAFYT